MYSLGILLVTLELKTNGRRLSVRSDAGSQVGLGLLGQHVAEVEGVGVTLYDWTRHQFIYMALSNHTLVVD